MALPRRAFWFITKAARYGIPLGLSAGGEAMAGGDLRGGTDGGQGRPPVLLRRRSPKLLGPR